MRKSKLIVLTILVMIFVLALSSLFAACDLFGNGEENPSGDVSGDENQGPPVGPVGPDGPPDDGDEDEEGEVPAYMSPNDALNKIANGADSPEEDTMSVDFEVKIDKPDTNEIITLLFQVNLFDTVKNELVLGVYLQGKDQPDESRAMKFALYVVDGKAYLDLGKDELGNDRALLYLSDFDMNYLIAMMKESPELFSELITMLNDLMAEKVGLTIDDVLNLVIGLLFEDPVATYNSETKVLENIRMKIKLRDLLQNASGILGAFDLGDLPLDLNIIFNYLLEVVPQADFYIDADFDVDGKLTDLDLDSVAHSDGATNKVQLSLDLGNTPCDMNIPAIDEMEISEFSLTNINFTIDFTLGTRINPDGSKTQLDVGKIINGFMGQNILPLDVLLLEGSTGLRLKFALDLDLNYDRKPVDNNKIAIELYLIDQFGNYQELEGDQPVPQMGIYYTEGSFYLNLDRLLPDYMKGVNLKVNAGLSDLINALVDLVTEAIDGVFGTSYDDIKNGNLNVNVEDNGQLSTTSGADVLKLLSSAKASGTSVVALSEGEDGKIYVSAGVQRFVQVIGELLMLPENIVADNDSIDIILNNDFLSSLNNLLKSETNPQPINFAFPDYIGDIVLSVNFSDIGLESVKVNAAVLDGESDPAFDVELKIWDFLIGTAKENLSVYIADRVNLDNTSYADSLFSYNERKGLIDKILGGITMSSRFTLNFNKGTYDLAPFIAGFGVTQLAQTEMLWTFNENFTLDAQLNIQISLDSIDAYNSQIVVELKTLDGIKVGGTTIIPANTVILGIYGYHNQIFIDLSNFKIASITLPKLSFSLNFTDLVYNLLGSTLGDLLEGAGMDSNLPFDFDLVELLGLNKTPGESADASAAATAYLTDQTSGTTGDGTVPEIPEEELQAIIFGLNCDEIYATVSLAAILSILSQTQTELGQTIAEALSLMELSLSFQMGRKNGFEFNFKGELIPMQDAEGNAVYYYDAEGNRLPSRDSDGNKIYYTSEEYARKEYNYGSGMTLSFIAGDDENPIIVGDIGDAKFDMEQKISEFEAYQSDLVQAIINTVGKATIKAKIDLQTLDNEMNLTKLINNILASAGRRLELPITLDLDDWNSFVELVVQWDLDLKNTANSTVVLTLSYEGKQIFGVYIYRNSLMIDLEGLGFFQVEIVNSNIITKLFGALDGIVSDIEGLDLNEIINDLLANSGLPTIPGAGDEENTDVEIATDEESADAALDDTTMDIIEYVLRAVGFEDTKITINVTAALFAEIINTLAGMNLGMDISLAADLDLFGGNAFNFDIGVEDISAQVNMQLAIGEAPVVNIDYDAIPDWDASNGETFTRSLLDNLNIGFTLDIANFTGDTIETKGANQAMYTRVIIEKLQTSKPLTHLSNPVTVPKGCFLITLAQIDSTRYENSNQGTFTPLIYVILDYTKASQQMTIHICSGVISLIVDIGDVIGALSFDLDLVGMLSGTFDNLFAQIDSALDGIGGSGDSGSGSGEVPPTGDGTTGGTTDGGTQSGGETTTTEPSPFDAIFANLDVVALLGGGIEASLLSNGNFGVNVKFDPYLINKLLDDILSLVFGPNTILNLAELAPDMFTDNYLSKVTWTREETGVFWDSLSAQVVPILKDLISSLGYGWVAPLITNALIGGVLGQVRNITAGILPFAVFNELTVNVEVADATIANISIDGFDWGQDIYDTNGEVAYSASKSGRKGNVNNNSVINRDGYFTSIKLYNTSDSVGKPVYGDDGGILFPEGIVTWNGIPMQITYDPYSYANNSEGVAAIIREHFSGKQASYQKAQDLYKATVVFKIVSENGITVDKTIDQLNFNTPGTYVVRGTAAFANNVTRTIDTVITVLDDGGGINSIDPVSMHVYDELPDFVTINLNDGTSRKIHTKYVTFSENAPQAYTEHTVVGKAAFANGTVVENVEFRYLDSTVTQINIDGVTGNVITIDLYQYNIKSTKITDYISDTIFFKYADGLSTGLEVSRDWVAVGADEFFNRALDKDGVYSTNVSGTQFMAYAYIGSGATEQRVELIFTVKTKNVAKLTINGLENTLRVDPYRYYMYLITGDEQYNPFPDVATAEYYDKYMSADGTQEIIDSYSEDVQITWGDYSGIDFSWDNNNTTSQNIQVSLDNADYPNSSFTWDFNTQVVVMRNEIEAIYFDDELTQSMYYIDPFEYFINEELGKANYPDHAYVQFTNGKVYYMPIEWIGTEDFEVKYANQFAQLKVRIGMDYEGKLAGVIGNFEQTITVNVRVEDLNPVGINLAGSAYTGGTYYIDPVRVNYYGESAFPETVTVVYDTGKTTELPVAEWIWDYQDAGYVPMAGQKGMTATAVITDTYRYDVNVEILDRSALVTDLKSVDIDSYTFTYDENGNRVYSVFTDTLLLYQKVGTINLDTVTVNGNVNMGTIAATSDYSYYFSYIINYSQTVDGEVKDFVFTTKEWKEVADFVANNKTLITSTEVRINYTTPVTWDLSEINYAVSDVYNVKAIAGTGASQKVFRISANVKAKTAADISSVGGSNTYQVVTWGGTSLTENEKQTKKIVKKLNVYFTDGTSGNYECTIDISNLAYTADDAYTLLIVSDGNNIVYKDNAGNVLSSEEEILNAAMSVKVTVFSGDIAIETTLKMHVVKQQINTASDSGAQG